jgi:hypothetical protein
MGPLGLSGEGIFARLQRDPPIMQLFNAMMTSYSRLHIEGLTFRGFPRSSTWAAVTG